MAPFTQGLNAQSSAPVGMKINYIACERDQPIPTTDEIDVVMIKSIYVSV